MAPRFSLSRAALPVAAFGVLSLGALGTAHAGMPQNLALGLREMALQYQTDAVAKGVPQLSSDESTAIVARHPLAKADGAGRVQVEVACDGTVPFDDVVASCEALRCTVTAKVDWYHQGTFSMWMPLHAAARIGKLPGVDSVKLSLKPRHHAGKVPGTGAQVLKATQANASGYLGAGITVGALSDSYNKVGTGSPVKAPADVASGDLPGAGNPEGYLTPVNVLKDYTTASVTADEGRAMLQIIHDVAPAAALAFYTADVSEADFAAGITALKAAGCNVICDDVGYYDEPIFSDGVVAQAVDKATAAGATYFSSAGNDGNSGWQGTFSPVNNDAAAQNLLLSEGGITYSGIAAGESAVISKFHSFGTNPDGTPILVQKVYVPKTNSQSYNGTLVFQWDDPSSVTVGGVKQVTTDYDILVFSVSNGVATYVSGKSGTKSNFSTNMPVEIPSGAIVAGTQYEFVIALTNRAANAGIVRDQATHLAWVCETDASQVIADFVGVNGVETHGHPAAATCAGTAAYIYDDQFSAASPVYTPIVEAYSSNGPVTIYFDAAGNRLSTPVVRKQPLLSTVDGVSTTFFPPEAGLTPSPATPSANDTDGDSYPNFFGTSAAAPHAAGCAALILSAANANGLTLTSQDVRNLLTSTTQGASDADPTVANATAGATKFSARDRGTYADPQAYTISYNGAAGTTLTTLVFDLSPVPGDFRPATYAVTTGVATSGVAGGTAPSIVGSTVTAADGVSTGTTTLTLTLANFTPGSTLSFGVAQTVAVTGGNYYIHGDQLAGAKIVATDSNGASSTGTLGNTFSKKWNYKTGYGLVDVNAAINKLLGL